MNSLFPILGVAIFASGLLLAAEKRLPREPVACASFLVVKPGIKFEYLKTAPGTDPKGAGGNYVGVVGGLPTFPKPVPIELFPPSDLYVRKGANYASVHVREDGVSLPNFINGPSESLTGLYIQVPPVRNDSSIKSPKKERDKPTYLPFATLSSHVNSGKWLVCMFKPPSAKEWSPPAIVEVSTDEDRFSISKTLLLNTSNFTVTVAIASGGVTSLPPGAHAVVNLPNSKKGVILFKSAYVSSGKSILIGNVTRAQSENARLIFVFRDNPGGDEKHEVAWFLCSLPMQTPPVIETPVVTQGANKPSA